MIKRDNFKVVLRLISRFLLFFVTVSFAISCCLMLFLSVLSQNAGITFTSDNIGNAAKITMLNVIFISIMLTLIDTLRLRYTVNDPAERIVEAVDRIMQGDFDVRIRRSGSFASDGVFADIIDSINKMANELSGVETLKNDFVANVSHEMKTPLAVIQNYARLLQNEDISEQSRKEYTDAIIKATVRLSDMVTNILKLNRLENQNINSKPEIYDLGEQLCECLLQYESIWDARKIDIDNDIEDGVTVCADRELLSLVWNNLLSNAFKFTCDGGRVGVRLKCDGEYATVTVSDTGCGMTKEVGEHIFEKFYQGDGSRATQGNGLGLALVKRVVDMIDGEIGVESELSVGSEFTVRIRRGDYGDKKGI